MKVMFKFCFFLVLLCGMSQFAGAATVPSPTEQLRPSLDALIKILADPSLKGDNQTIVRRDKIMAIVQKRFDFTEMSKRVLGPTWKTITPEQRKEFTGLMTRLLEHTYIGQVEGYSGETVEYTGEQIKGTRAQVSTQITHQGSKFPVYYILTLEKDQWLVYDVNIEGVSLIRNYRAEFSSILRKDKYEGLVKTIKSKLAKYNK